MCEDRFGVSWSTQTHNMPTLTTSLRLKGLRTLLEQLHTLQDSGEFPGRTQPCVGYRSSDDILLPLVLPVLQWCCSGEG
jgi:hypothetical protein